MTNLRGKNRAAVSNALHRTTAHRRRSNEEHQPLYGSMRFLESILNSTKSENGYRSEIKRPPLDSTSILDQQLANSTSSSSAQPSKAQSESGEGSGYMSEIKRPPFDVGILPQVVNSTTSSAAQAQPEAANGNQKPALDFKHITPVNNTKKGFWGDGSEPNNKTSATGVIAVNTTMVEESASASELAGVDEKAETAAPVDTKPPSPEGDGGKTEQPAETVAPDSKKDGLDEELSATNAPNPAETPATDAPEPAASAGTKAPGETILPKTNAPRPAEKPETDAPKATLPPRTPAPTIVSVPRPGAPSKSMFSPDGKKPKSGEDVPRTDDKLQRPTAEPLPADDGSLDTNFIPGSNKDTSLGVNCYRSGGFLGRMSCQTTAAIHGHPIVFALVSVVVALLLCRLCRCCCCAGKKRDDRGEYRAVAEQYGEMLYDNTFDENYSYNDAHSAGSMMSDDEEEDDWSQGGVKIEMSGIREQNGGLSLEEMNG